MGVSTTMILHFLETFVNGNPGVTNFDLSLLILSLGSPAILLMVVRRSFSWTHVVPAVVFVTICIVSDAPIILLQTCQFFKQDDLLFTLANITQSTLWRSLQNIALCLAFFMNFILLKILFKKNR